MLSVVGIFTEYAFNSTMACHSNQLIMIAICQIDLVLFPLEGKPDAIAQKQMHYLLSIKLNQESNLRE